MTRSGFTLVEIVLALALIVVLMGLLGMTIDVYLRAADGSRTGVEESRVARLVLQRIGDDLRNAVPVPIGASSAAGSSSQPNSSQDVMRSRFPTGGVCGNRRELLANISRMPLLDQSAAESGALPSDLRTVIYRLGTSDTPGRSDTADEPSKPCGLVRGEWERATRDWAIQEGQAAQLTGALTMLAPEVDAIEFTYFDGDTPYSEWDSFEREGLPTMVKIAVSIRRPKRPAASSSASESIAESQSTVYEALVCLPNAEVTSDSAAADASSQSTSGSQAGSSSAPSSGNATP